MMINQPGAVVAGSDSKDMQKSSTSTNNDHHPVPEEKNVSKNPPEIRHDAPYGSKFILLHRNKHLLTDLRILDDEHGVTYPLKLLDLKTPPGVAYGFFDLENPIRLKSHRDGEGYPKNPKVISNQRITWRELNWVTCVICDAEKLAHRMEQSYKCGHYFCLECVQGYVAETIKSRASKVVYCPQSCCLQTLDPEVASDRGWL